MLNTYDFVDPAGVTLLSLPTAGSLAVVAGRRVAGIDCAQIHMPEQFRQCHVELEADRIAVGVNVRREIERDAREYGSVFLEIGGTGHSRQRRIRAGAGFHRIR